jgi:uncharacterized protein with von Willebrand factor type A (vWA) domain
MCIRDRHDIEQNSGKTTVRNNMVYAHFIELIGDYYQIRKKIESELVIQREQLILTARSLKERLEYQLARAASAEEAFVPMIKDYISILQEEFKEQMICPEFVYFIFKDKELRYFQHLFLNESHERLMSMGRHRMGELLFLEKHACYERL